MRDTKVYKFISFSFLICIMLSFAQCHRSESDTLYNRRFIDEIKAARQDIIFYMSGNFIPGGTFAIAREGKIIYSEGLGLASKDLEVPVNRQTKFRIGEISELFTSLIYHKMVENGTLHPDSSARFYFPDFPEKRYPIALHHLINQTSGIRQPSEEERDWRGLNVSLKKGIDTFKNDSLVAPPGMYQIPGIFNYNLLGAIMENKTGKTLQSILEEYVTDTLGLKNTIIDNPFITIKNRSDFYDHNYISQVINATTRDMRFRGPSEGMLSNAEDLVKLGNALLFSDYFTEELKSKLFTPVLLHQNMQARMANGWILMNDNQGRTIYGKSGSVTGGSAALLVYPEEKLVVACATNQGSVSDDCPVFKMASHFLKGKKNQREQRREEKGPADTSKPEKDK